MRKTKEINIEGTSITMLSQKKNDFISLTDMAKNQLQEVVIIKWLSLKSTIEYLGEWEALYNPNFNYTEFGIIKNEADVLNMTLFGTTAKQWRDRRRANSYFPLVVSCFLSKSLRNQFSIDTYTT